MTFETHFLELFRGKDTFTDILGQTASKEQIKSALITNRHILILGPPGIGKTTLVKNIARLLPEITNEKGETVSGDDRFIRVQGSPDLTSEDLLGDIDPIKALEYGPLSKEAFSPGKLFKADKGILFFDEVNRCSEKLQNALLQALEEGIVTIGSYEVDMPSDFIFVGTLNPQDSSTEKLSDAFMDRFDLIKMNYPETDELEKKIVLEKSQKLQVEFPANLISHVVSFVRQLRDSEKLKRLPSVRATMGIYERAQAMALLRGKSAVELEDITSVIVSVLSHRIELKPSYKYLESPEEFLKSEFLQYAKGEQLTTNDTLFDEEHGDYT